MRAAPSNKGKRKMLCNFFHAVSGVNRNLFQSETLLLLICVLLYHSIIRGTARKASVPIFSASFQTFDPTVLMADGQEPNFSAYFAKHTPGVLQINSKCKGK